MLYILCYPNEKHDKEEETTLQLFSYLENDDIEVLLSFLSQHPEIDIHKNIELTYFSYYYYIFDNSHEIQLIDFCCLFCSVKCFKYFYNNTTITSLNGFSQTTNVKIFLY